jgi:spore maturation protein CgeB
MSNTKAIFYSMGSRCGHCLTSEKLLAKEIASGEIVKKGPQDAPPGVQGFPHFLSASDPSKSSSGAPQSKEQLYQKLGISMENYEHMDSNPEYMKMHNMYENYEHTDSNPEYMKMHNMYVQMNKLSYNDNSQPCKIPEMYHGVF